MKALLEALLMHRRKIKAKKPHFLRHALGSKKQLDAVWRKPKGHQNRMRLSMKGRGTMVGPGWGSPREVKHLSREGLSMVVVQRLADLLTIDPAVQTIIIGSTVGNKNRLAIITAALEKKISIHNIRKPEVRMEKIKSDFKIQQASKKKVVPTPKKEPKREELGEKVDKEVDKAEEKKEMEKVLTKKQ